jgi:membrane protein
MSIAAVRPATKNVAVSNPGRPPWWVPALTAGLLAIGFTRQRYAAPSPAGDHAAARESGRLASTPAKMPARAWKDVLLRVWNNIGEDRIMLVAAGVTFYALLAIFPAIAALVALYGLFADPSSIAATIDTLSGVVPSGALDVVRQEMNRVASAGPTKLGVAFAFGFLISLWSANAGIKSIFDALNIVYNEKEKRGLIGLNLISLGFTLAAIVFVLVAIGAIAAMPAVFSFSQMQGPSALQVPSALQGSTALVAQIARWPILFVVIAFGLALVYRYGPSRAEPQWRWISWGSALAAIAWVAVSVAFSWYAANFGSYNKTYGSLGAIVVFMFWIWLSVSVILIGAELDAEMEHQTVRDTTTGGGKPMGVRGARMANTFGPGQD